MSRDRVSPPTVYVVRNLPEVMPEEIPREFASRYNDSVKYWISRSTYAARIGEGVGLALNLIPRVEEVPLFRYHGDGVANGRLHKHFHDVNILGGILNKNKAPTRFLDYRTMLEQALDNKESGEIEARLNGDSASLRELANVDKDHKFRSVGESEFVPKYRHEAEFEKLVSAHSQEVIIDRGDLVLWANDGHLFHQARPGNEPEKGLSSLARAIVGWGFKRKHNLSGNAK